MLTSIAYAAAGAPAGGTGGPMDMVASFLPLVLMFAVFYFLLIRPQQKKAKAHKEMLGKLQKGDYVLTTGGLLGRVVEVQGEIFTVDLGDSKVRIPRSYIAGTYDPKELDGVAKTEAK